MRSNQHASLGYTSLSTARTLSTAATVGAFIGWNLWVPGAPAFAQEFPRGSEIAATAQVQDVVVTGGKDEIPGAPTAREIKTLETSTRSIAIVNGRKAQLEHLDRLSDFAQLVPNYRPQEGNATTSRPAIRGVSSTIGQLARSAGNSIGAEYDTGFIIDNVFWKFPSFQATDLVDLESFELALGPQGTAGGKNTTVGTVIVRTALPSFTRLTSVETSFANRNHLITKIHATGPVIGDKLAYRLTFFRDKGDGWIFDQITGTDYLNDNRWGIRGQLLYVDGDITDRLIFNYNKSKEYANTGVLTTGPFADSFQVYANGTRPPLTYSQNLWNRLGRQVLTFDPSRPYVARAGTTDNENLQISNEINWNIPGYTLTSISAYGNAYIVNHNPAGNNNVNLSFSDPQWFVDQFSEEVRLTSLAGERFEWLTGIYSLYENAFSRSPTTFGPDAATWYGRLALLYGAQTIRDAKARTFHIGAYGQGTYHLDNAWSLTFGLRQSYEIRQGSVSNWQKHVPSQFTFAQQYAAILAGAGGGARFYDTGASKADSIS
jgi:iron complex outermembrane receptor protein